MTHDPFCPYHEHTLIPLHENCDNEVCEEWRCQCDLIRAVREDQEFRVGEGLWLKSTRDNFGRHGSADTLSNITEQPPNEGE
jgi:hypothetical protein